MSLSFLMVKKFNCKVKCTLVGKGYFNKQMSYYNNRNIFSKKEKMLT
jgi:hypothetical protein